MNETITQFFKNYGVECRMPLVALFDMDGVLYDSMWNHAYSWQESMKHYGIHMTEMDAFKYEGMRGVETIQHITLQQRGKAVSDEEAAEMYRYKSKQYAARGVAPMIPGVHKLQEAMHDHNMMIGVVTGSGQPTLLSRIMDDFSGLVNDDVIVTANDVKQGKPEPDPYLMGMQKATIKLRQEGKLKYDESLQPWQTVVIENAPLGIKAAKAAGCLTIAVNTGPLPDSLLKEAGADAVVKTMNDARLLLFNK